MIQKMIQKAVKCVISIQSLFMEFISKCVCEFLLPRTMIIERECRRKRAETSHVKQIPTPRNTCSLQ